MGLYLTTRNVYARFLRAIADELELGKRVMLDGLISGQYRPRKRDDVRGFSYLFNEHEIATLFYRGKKDEKHGFYFVITPELGELNRKQLLCLVQELGDVDKRTENLEIFREHVFCHSPEVEEKPRPKWRDGLSRIHESEMGTLFKKPKSRKAV